MRQIEGAAVVLMSAFVVRSSDVSSNPIRSVDGSKFSGNIGSIRAKNVSLTDVASLAFPPMTKHLCVATHLVTSMRCHTRSVTHSRAFVGCRCAQRLVAKQSGELVELCSTARSR